MNHSSFEPAHNLDLPYSLPGPGQPEQRREETIVSQTDYQQLGMLGPNINPHRVNDSSYIDVHHQNAGYSRPQAESSGPDRYTDSMQVMHSLNIERVNNNSGIHGPTNTNNSICTPAVIGTVAESTRYAAVAQNTQSSYPHNYPESTNPNQPRAIHAQETVRPAQETSRPTCEQIVHSGEIGMPTRDQTSRPTRTQEMARSALEVDATQSSENSDPGIAAMPLFGPLRSTASGRSCSNPDAAPRNSPFMQTDHVQYSTQTQHSSSLNTGHGLTMLDSSVSAASSGNETTASNDLNRTSTVRVGPSTQHAQGTINLQHHQHKNIQLPATRDSAIKVKTADGGIVDIQFGHQAGGRVIIEAGNPRGGQLYAGPSVAATTPKPHEKKKVRLEVPKRLLSHNDMDRIAETLGKDWRRLGTQLGFGSGQLDIMEHDYSGLREIIFQMVLKWKSENGTGSTLKAMVTALCAIKRADVARLFQNT